MDAWDSYRLLCVSASPSDAQTHYAEVTEEETQDRLGLVEEYITDTHVLRQRLPRVIAQMCYRDRQRFLNDEAEERRFIEEDAALLPYKMFVEVSFSEATRLLAELERAARQRLYHEYLFSFATEVVGRWEEVDRLRVTSEALDSLALKACHVGRLGLRGGRLGHTDAGPLSTSEQIFVSVNSLTVSDSAAEMKRADNDAAALRMQQQETEERILIDTARCQYVTCALPAWLHYLQQCALECH